MATIRGRSRRAQGRGATVGGAARLPLVGRRLQKATERSGGTDEREVATRPILAVLLFALGSAPAAPAHAGDKDPPAPGVVDSAKIKARELDKQRLIAKLHAEVPKVHDAPAGVNPLSAPIFHRYDRP